jgi:hypothetical protein
MGVRGMGVVRASSHLSIHGRLSVTSVDGEWFRAHRDDTALMLAPPNAVVDDRREGDNIMCTAGLTVLASALVWSGIQDQAANLGVTAPTYLTPLWGAVGSGSGTVSAADTALFSELSRQTVGAGASVPATASLSSQLTWLFYFPQPSASWTVTEAGVFCNGSSNDTDTATAGVLLDHWAFSPTLTVPTTNTLILQASFAIGA